jgi:hypothetical protein
MRTIASPFKFEVTMLNVYRDLELPQPPARLGTSICDDDNVPRAAAAVDGTMILKKVDQQVAWCDDDDVLSANAAVAGTMILKKVDQQVARCRQSSSAGPLTSIIHHHHQPPQLLAIILLLTGALELWNVEGVVACSYSTCRICLSFKNEIVLISDMRQQLTEKSSLLNIVEMSSFNGGGKGRRKRAGGGGGGGLPVAFDDENTKTSELPLDFSERRLPSLHRQSWRTNLMMILVIGFLMMVPSIVLPSGLQFVAPSSGEVSMAGDGGVLSMSGNGIGMQFSEELTAFSIMLSIDLTFIVAPSNGELALSGDTIDGLPFVTPSIMLPIDLTFVVATSNGELSTSDDGIGKLVDQQVFNHLVGLVDQQQVDHQRNDQQLVVHHRVVLRLVDHQLVDRQLVVLRLDNHQLADQQFVNDQLMGRHLVVYQQFDDHQLLEHQLPVDQQLFDHRFLDPQLVDQQLLSHRLVDDHQLVIGWLFDHLIMEHQLDYKKLFDHRFLEHQLPVDQQFFDHRFLDHQLFICWLFDRQLMEHQLDYQQLFDHQLDYQQLHDHSKDELARFFDGGSSNSASWGSGCREISLTPLINLPWIGLALIEASITTWIYL